MAIPSPTNCWTSTEAKIAAAIANSAAFQAFTETSDATAAGAFVFGEQVDEPLNGEAYTRDEETQRHMRYAQVYSAPQQPYGKRRLQTRAYEPFGSAVIYIEGLVREIELSGADIPQEHERRFKNTIGDIMDDILDYLDTNGGPQVSSMTVEDGPGWNPVEEWEANGAWQGCELQISWGFEQ